MKTTEEKLQRNFERQRTYQQRAIERQREKLANPEWRQAQYEKHRERQSRYIERAKNKPFKRGLKGRTPRAAERLLMDKIGALLLPVLPVLMPLFPLSCKKLVNVCGLCVSRYLLEHAYPLVVM